MKITSAAIAAIVTIPAIIRKSKNRDCNDRKERRDRACPAISTIPAILWKSILSDCHDRSDLNDRNDRNDHMETESGLYFGKGTKKFHYVFIFRFRNYFLGANVPPEIISLDALVEMEIFAKINFIKQGKLLSMIPQIKIGHILPFGDQSLKTCSKIITHCLKL